MTRLETNGINIWDYDALRNAYVNGKLDIPDDVLYGAIKQISPYNTDKEKHDEFINLTVKRATYQLLKDNK